MKTLIVAYLVALPFLLNAQWNDRNLFMGFQWNANNSLWGIADLPEMIIPSPFFENKNFKTREHGYFTENDTLGNELFGWFNANFFFYTRFEDFPYLAFQGDIGVSQHKGGYSYSDDLGLKYSLRVKYWYAPLTLSVKLYPGLIFTSDEIWYNGFFVRPGGVAGFILTPENLYYKHAPEEIYGPSEYQERELRLFNKGKGYLGWTLGVGYDLPLGEDAGLGFEVRYTKTTDLINTLPTPYNYGWSNKDNYYRSVQFGISYAFKINKAN